MGKNTVKRAGKEELEAVLNNHTADIIIDRNNENNRERTANVAFTRPDGLVVKIKNYAGRTLAHAKSIYKNGALRTVLAGTKWEDIPAEFKPFGAFALAFAETDFLPEKENK